MKHNRCVARVSDLTEPAREHLNHLMNAQAAEPPAIMRGSHRAREEKPAPGCFTWSRAARARHQTARQMSRPWRGAPRPGTTKSEFETLQRRPQSKRRRKSEHACSHSLIVVG